MAILTTSVFFLFVGHEFMKNQNLEAVVKLTAVCVEINR